MKSFKHLFSVVLLLIVITASAQTPYFKTNGPITADSISTNKLNVTSGLKLNGNVSLPSLSTGTSGNFLMVDSNGILRKANPVSVLSTNSCDTTAPEWTQGGNMLGGKPDSWHTIGTCDNEDFVLKSGNNPSVWVKPNGNVGFGTYNPRTTVEIAGQLRIGNADSNFIDIFYDTEHCIIDATGHDSLNHGKDLLINYYHHNKCDIGPGTLNATGSFNSAKETHLATDSGIVTIGGHAQTSSGHANAMLQVYGDLVVGTNGNGANVWVTQQNWSDFVFDKNYVLMPTDELEAFYKKNKHLPNVPTTKEIQENGNNLGQTDAVLLQKIEENTLYIVELQKQLEAQKKLVEGLIKKLEKASK